MVQPETAQTSDPTFSKTISGTTYIVTGQLSQTARETAADKIRRMILNEASKLPKDT